MEIVPKTPQEIAAQAKDAYPYFGGLSMSEDETIRLDNQAKELKEDIEELKPYTLSDQELALKLAEATAEAAESGVWRADKGEGADERIDFATRKRQEWGYSEEEATAEAAKALKNNGYLSAIRDQRKEKERLFRNPINEYIGHHQMDAEAETQEIDSLLQRTIDITTLTENERAKLASDFLSGNFLYHGTGTEQLVKVLDTGVLASGKTLQEREVQAAEAEGRETKFIRRNSGFEGISWSMNGVDALPGDRYHLAGFVAAPETILGSEQQLAVPSRPAPNEVLQISDAIEANEFYDAKTQFELYKSIGLFSEANSLSNNLIAVSRWKDEESRKSMDEPLLYQARRDVLAGPKYKEELRKLFTVEEGGAIRLSPDLLQQVDNETPVAAVWLQAVIDTGRLEGTKFAGEDVPTIIGEIDKENIKELLSISHQDWQQYEMIIDEAENNTDHIEVPVENMYFVAPQKDAEAWLKVIARSGHKPAGILLYDDKKVRLENFASSHRGDHEELTQELRSAIVPDEGYIEYSQVLGSDFHNDMRVGYRHHVIGDKHLQNRQSIKKRGDKLVVTSAER